MTFIIWAAIGVILFLLVCLFRRKEFLLEWFCFWIFGVPSFSFMLLCLIKGYMFFLRLALVILAVAGILVVGSWLNDLIKKWK